MMPAIADAAPAARRTEGRAGTVLVYLVLLAAVKGALATVGYARTRRALERLARRGGERATGERGSIDAVLVAREAKAVAWAAAFYPGRALCLEQSLALYLRLRRAAVPASFHLGVQPHPFAAHAWVSVGGEPVNERGEIVRQLVPLPEPEVRVQRSGGR